MANTEMRHAAGRPTYAIYELLQGTPALDPRILRRSCDNFDEAVEYAMAFLDRRDPDRTGRVQAIEIEKLSDEQREIVWTYEYQPGFVPTDLVARWGFDVTRSWQGPPPFAAKPTRFTQ